MRLVIAFGGIVILTQIPCPASAQRVAADLSEAEVEQVRDTAQDAAGRVLVFTKIVDTRADQVEHVVADVRAQGRAEDIHRSFSQMTGILNELEDNLDEAADAHKDMRKALPKLTAAAERWATVVREPPENPHYKLSRDLVLEAIADVAKDAKDTLAEQQKYFKEHPPSKEQKRDEE